MQRWPFVAMGKALEVIPRTLAQNCGANIIRQMTVRRGPFISHEVLAAVRSFALSHFRLFHASCARVRMGVRVFPFPRSGAYTARQVLRARQLRRHRSLHRVTKSDQPSTRFR